MLKIAFQFTVLYVAKSNDEDLIHDRCLSANDPERKEFPIN
jgi:hypothetical protein